MRNFAVRQCRWLLRLAAAGLLLAASTASAEPAHGLPFSRSYSFEDVGDISRGAHLSFDRFGRLVVVQDGAFVVLNDNAWLDLGAKNPAVVKIQHAMCDADGSSYYGALGTCGRLQTSPDGRVQPISVLPAQCPGWVAVTSFTLILSRPEAVYFAGFNGAVVWHRETRAVTFVEVPGLASLFALHDRVYVSSHPKGVQQLDPVRGALTEVDAERFGSQTIDNVAMLDDGHAIMSTTGRRLFIHDGTQIAPLPGPLGRRLDGRIVALQRLSNGRIAAAVANKGLYFFTAEGEVVNALSDPEYRQITALAAKEPGVLWAATETGVTSILYGVPITWFGQALGLPVGWPQIVNWHDTLVVGSNGRIYERIPTGPGEATRFHLLEDQPASGAWGLAVVGDWLLAGNGEGVFARRAGGSFVRILPGFDTARLVALPSGVCFAIGAAEIAALRCDQGEWHECAPRVPGVGYPSLVHAAKDSGWIEIGTNRAARVALRVGRIETRVFSSFPWTEPRWVNVSVVGHVVVLTGPDNGRVFFDETTETLSDHSPIEAILDRTPHWAARVQPDDTGTWWITHEHGFFPLRPKDGGFEADTVTYRIVSDHFPSVHPLPGGDVWVARRNSLYHLEPRSRAAARPPFQPTLVSVRDVRTDEELLGAGPDPVFARPLPYARNSLALRFFAGSYQAKRTPVYELRINGSPWSRQEDSSLLRLSDLREGRYRLDVRLIDESGPLGSPTTFSFSIAAPWYRTWYAGLGYVVAGLALVLAIVRVSLNRARARNTVLEKMVAARTEELKATMEKLQQETRVAATLAERNRLAGEIHDSLEQGFSGLLLQLETTAGFTDCPPHIHQALGVARNMVAYSRNEVRHAVWDLHSPMLDSGGLEPALRNIVAHLAPDPTHATIVVEGEGRPVGSTLEHHLLRIAQEAIANAVKHASATHLDIRLAFTGTNVRLVVGDNGRGFDPGTVLTGRAGHFGLRGLRSRAGKIGATLEIDSRPGAGTTITVTAPRTVTVI
jgi:signal transduction histidine kinase